eukprot:1818888-Prymnesium_polylepis.1
MACASFARAALAAFDASSRGAARARNHVSRHQHCSPICERHTRNTSGTPAASGPVRPIQPPGPAPS